MNNHILQVLITDDDEADRRHIKRIFKETQLPCVCSEAACFEEAVLACERTAFDLAVVDYNLPGQDGLACITAINERLPFCPVIMSTGQGDEMIATEAMKRGAADYISKARVNAASMQRAVQNALEKAAMRRKIKEQQEALELFARVLVHDLRAPAAAIQTFTERIGEWLEEQNQEKAIEYAGWVNQTAQRMIKLIDTLHKYTTADAKVAFEEVDMDQALASALANLEQTIQEKGSKVTADALPTVLGNAPQLIQLLQNLIGNGIKYCDKAEPFIHIGASVRDASEDDKNTVLFSVTDNGIGISAADYKRVFEPFVRVSTGSRRDGTGLGLATCKKIIERHGSKIWCESKPGEGTCFFFTLPSAARVA
jgi:signal transduction histidine kinase